jgi:hypothetical protein
MYLSVVFGQGTNLLNDHSHLEGADCGGHGRLLGAGGQLQVLPRIPGMLLLSL